MIKNYVSNVAIEYTCFYYILFSIDGELNHIEPPKFYHKLCQAIILLEIHITEVLLNYHLSYIPNITIFSQSLLSV